MENKELKIAAFTNNTASEYWRFNGIARLMEKNTPHRMKVEPFSQWGEWEANDMNGANLVILEQLTNPNIVDFCHDRGIKVIFESDDAMIDSYGRERKNLMHLGDAFRGKSIETIRKCDAMTVTNQKLAESYARFTKEPIYVLPNYVDFDWYDKKDLLIQRTTDEIRIGWFGSQGHFEDLRAILPALGRVLDKYKNVKLIYCGYGGMSSDKASTEVNFGEDVFKEIPRNRREFYPATKPEYWPDKHRTLDLDIGICPLVDDYFNWCKTNIKWLEFAMMSTPTVCSNVLYGDFVRQGKDGFIAKTEDDWVNYLSILITNKKQAKQMGKAARRTAEQKYDLERHYMEYVDVYEKVVNT